MPRGEPAARVAGVASAPPVLVDSPAAGIAAITLDRAERGNALSADLVDALADAFGRAVADESVHTVVLRASGRHFCTGFDLSDFDGETDATLLARLVRIEILLDMVWRAPVRTVAIGQGRIIGAGADLFAACDLRLLAAGASLRFPGAGFGIVLGTRRLAQRVGDATALRWVGEAATITADEAVATGLASGFVASAEGAACVEALNGAPSGAPAPLPAALAELSVDRRTFAALRRAVRDDWADADLGALVRSAAPAGLKARIETYRDRQLSRPSPPGANGSTNDRP